MKSLAMGFVALGLCAYTAPARASVWEIDSAHSSTEFSVKHMMVATVKGRFDKVAGTLNLDDKNPTKSTVELTIDANTIDTHEPKRDGHLKSPDFFDVAKFPTITFKSTKIEKAGKAKFKVTGDLTMHGVTKPVTLAVEGPTAPMKNLMGSTSSGATATGKINRKDWGLNWNKPLEAAGGVLVGDEVTINVDLELVSKPEAPAAAAAPAAAPAKTAAAAPAAAPAKTAAAAPAAPAAAPLAKTGTAPAPAAAPKTAAATPPPAPAAPAKK
jgi:polyisoprenoid-binding protein YceI